MKDTPENILHKIQIVGRLRDDEEIPKHLADRKEDELLDKYLEDATKKPVHTKRNTFGASKLENKDQMPYTLKTFFYKYWQWIITVLLIPFIVWVVKDRKKTTPQPPTYQPLIVNISPTIEQNTTLKIDNNNGIADPNIHNADEVK